MNEKTLVGFPGRLPTHNALDWVGSSKHCLEDVHHSFVPKDGLLKHCQEVLMGENSLLGR